MWAILKVFIESVTVLLLFYASVCWPQSIQSLDSRTRDGTHTCYIGREVLTAGSPAKSQFTFFKPRWFCCRFLEARVIQTASPPRLSHETLPQGWPFGHLGGHNPSDTDSHSLCGCVCKLVISFRELFSMTDDGESAPTKRQKRGWKSQSSGKRFVPTDVAHCQGLKT